MLNACGWNRTSQTRASQKGAEYTPLKITKILYIRRFCSSGTAHPKHNGCIIYYCFLSSFLQAHQTAKPLTYSLQFNCSHIINHPFIMRPVSSVQVGQFLQTVELPPFRLIFAMC